MGTPVELVGSTLSTCCAVVQSWTDRGGGVAAVLQFENAKGISIRERQCRRTGDIRRVACKVNVMERQTETADRIVRGFGFVLGGFLIGVAVVADPVSLVALAGALMLWGSGTK